MSSVLSCLPVPFAMLDHFVGRRRRRVGGPPLSVRPSASRNQLAHVRVERRCPFFVPVGTYFDAFYVSVALRYSRFC